LAGVKPHGEASFDASGADEPIASPERGQSHDKNEQFFHACTFSLMW